MRVLDYVLAGIIFGLGIVHCLVTFTCLGGFQGCFPVHRVKPPSNPSHHGQALNVRQGPGKKFVRGL